MMSNGEQLYQAHKDWVGKVIGLAGTQPSCLYGAVESGKSTLLKYLADAQPFSDVHVIYWDLSPSVKLLGSGREFWDAFARVLKYPNPETVNVDDTKNLEELVADAINFAPGEDNKPIVLILDHWDKALDDPQHVIDDKALNRLNHLLLAHFESHESDRRCRPVVVTNFPNTQAIVEWARERQDSSPGLYALSGVLLGRRYTAANMPFISSLAAKELLVDSGMTKSLADEVAKDSGGWLVAMNAALSLSDNREKRLDEVMPEINRAVREALARRLFPHLRRSHPQKSGLSEIKWIGQTLAQYDRGTFRWSQLGLPTRPASEQLADCIRRVCEAPPFLFVDLENLTHWETLPENRVDALENIATTFSVPDRNVYVITRNAERIKDLLGEVPATWHQHWSALTGERKKQKRESGDKDNSDDVVLSSLVASTVALFPMATTYILSGDQDFWSALSPILHGSSRVKQLFPGVNVPNVLITSPWVAGSNVWTKALKAVGAKWEPKAQKGTEVQTNVMP